MAKILCSPSKYVQGAGEMKKLGEYAQKYGKKALVLITESGYKRIGDVVNTGFEGYEITPVYEYFNRECSKNEINRLVDIMNEKGCDVVIGIGGGKILDTAKAVAYYKEAPALICPTIASTDAPCSALSVIYTDDGVFEEYLFLPANPNMVLMDTEIIAKSPVRLTVSGMGDALATYFEARACQASGATTCAGGQVTQAAIALAKLCFDTLMAEGVKAFSRFQKSHATSHGSSPWYHHSDEHRSPDQDTWQSLSPCCQRCPHISRCGYRVLQTFLHWSRQEASSPCRTCAGCALQNNGFPSVPPRQRFPVSS